MLVLSLKLILLLLIFTGMFHYCYSKLKIDVHFIPVISFSLIAIILFFAGLLNIMFETTFILNSLLLIYFIHILVTKQLNSKFLTFGFYFAAFLLLFFSVIFKGTMLTAYDDFSHWGLMAREIIQNDQLPNFETPFLTFTSYPPGSALFLYYIGKIMGYSEGILFFGQGLLLISGILPFFALVKNNKTFKYIMIVLSTVFLLTVNNHVFMLSVDTMLTVISLAVTAMLVYLYSNGELYKAPVMVTPVLSLLILVKNSGVLFVLINIFIFILLSYRSRGNKQLNRPKSLILLFPFVLSFLWGKHVDIVFAKGLETKHSFSVENFRNVFGDKTLEDIREIIGSLLTRIISFSDIDVQVFFGILLTLVVLNGYKRLRQTNAPVFTIELKLLVSSLILYLLYQVSLGGMYVFSMPLSEAVNLAGYDRYNLTIVSYIFGLLLIYVLMQNYSRHTSLESFMKLLLIFIVSSFILAPEINQETRLSEKHLENGNYRNEILKAKGNLNIPSNKDVYLYYSDRERISGKIGYLNYVARFDFSTYDVSIIDSSSIQSVIDQKNDYYIIFVDQDDIYDELSYKANVTDERIIYMN